MVSRKGLYLRALPPAVAVSGWATLENFATIDWSRRRYALDRYAHCVVTRPVSPSTKSFSPTTHDSTPSPHLYYDRPPTQLPGCFCPTAQRSAVDRTFAPGAVLAPREGRKGVFLHHRHRLPGLHPDRTAACLARSADNRVIPPPNAVFSHRTPSRLRGQAVDVPRPSPAAEAAIAVDHSILSGATPRAGVP